MKIVSRKVFLFLSLILTFNAFSKSIKFSKNPSSVFTNKYNGRSVGVIVSSYASHRRLCGSNEQLGGDTFEYGDQCCEVKDNKCISQKKCRTPVANCIYERSDGSTEVYKSSGVRECGKCEAVDDLAAVEVSSPF